MQYEINYNFDSGFSYTVNHNDVKEALQIIMLKDFKITRENKVAKKLLNFFLQKSVDEDIDLMDYLFEFYEHEISEYFYDAAEDACYNQESPEPNNIYTARPTN